MKTVFLAKFIKDIEKIRSQAVKEAVAEVIEQVESSVNLDDIANLKKLKGYKDAYRIRIGEYRIGGGIEGETVEFARVVHRREIYRSFP